MAGGFIPPDHWAEVTGMLRKSGSVILDANGNGVILFDVDNASQRWVVTSIVTTTNQPAIATLVPYCTGALNTYSVPTLSPSNQFGTSYSGNNDQFSGALDVSPTDTFCVLYYPPPGQSGASLSGVKATAIIRGTYFTRRS
jgi:hypothetical protein